MKKERFAAVALLLFLLTGCKSNDTYTEAATLPPLPTEETIETESAAETLTTEESNEGGIVGGFTSFLGMEEMDGSLTYTGNILSVPYTYEGSGVGIGHPNGFGVLLMLNGVPQPYYTDDEQDWAYIHMMPDEPDVEHTVNLNLIPVTGEQGDDLTLTLLKVNDPEYRMSDDGICPFKLVDMPVIVGRNIHFMATPPECPRLEVTSRILDIKMINRETDYSEIAGWDDHELDVLTEHNSHLIVGGKDSGPHAQVWGASTNDSVVLHIEVWGNPAAKQSLVLYVNNEPQIIDPSQVIHFSTEQGKTTEFDITIDNSDMDEETIIYGVRIVENYLECDPEMIGAQYNIIGQQFILKDEWSEERFPIKGPGES